MVAGTTAMAQPGTQGALQRVLPSSLSCHKALPFPFSRSLMSTRANSKGNKKVGRAALVLYGMRNATDTRMLSPAQHCISQPLLNTWMHFPHLPKGLLAVKPSHSWPRHSLRLHSPDIALRPLPTGDNPGMLRGQPGSVVLCNLNLHLVCTMIALKDPSLQPQLPGSWEYP